MGVTIRLEKETYFLRELRSRLLFRKRRDRWKVTAFEANLAKYVGTVSFTMTMVSRVVIIIKVKKIEDRPQLFDAIFKNASHGWKMQDSGDLQ